MLYQRIKATSSQQENQSEPTSCSQSHLIQYLKTRLEEVLLILQREKQEHDSRFEKQRKEFTEKLQQKDQIIQRLVKSIYNFKMENQQLRFQYERRFKLIRQMGRKYQNLLTEKNIKISHSESVILYLQNKIKNIQKPQDQNSKNSVLFNTFNPIKAKDITTKQNIFLLNSKKQMKKSCIQSLRNLQITDHTIPLKRSHLSATSKNSSSNSHTRLRIPEYAQKRKSNDDCISFFQVQEYQDDNSSDIFDVDINLGNKNLDSTSKSRLKIILPKPKSRQKSQQN